MKLKMATAKTYEVTREMLDLAIKNVGYDSRNREVSSVTLTDVPVALMTESIDTVYDICLAVISGATDAQREVGYNKARSYYGTRRRTISRPEAIALLIRNVSFMHQWKFQNTDESNAPAYFYEHLTFLAVCLDLYLATNGIYYGQIVCVEVSDGPV